MEILYLLLPLSLVIVALIGALLWWAVFSGQYDDVERDGLTILQDDDQTFS
jgi:cbb3-type cytochrome oxidase maturation protein